MNLSNKKYMHCNIKVLLEEIANASNLAIG